MFKKLYNSVCAEIKIDKKVRISVYLSVFLLYCIVFLYLLNFTSVRSKKKLNVKIKYTLELRRPTSQRVHNFKQCLCTG